MGKNMSHLSMWDDIQYHKRTHSRQQEHQRGIDAQQRKENLQRDDLKMKYFLVHRWEFIKEKKTIFQQQFLEAHQKRQYKRVWAEIILSKQVLKDVFS